MKVLLLLAFAGFACALQPSLKYSYKYFGSVETGIPEINSQGATAAIKADIEVQMQDDGLAIIKLSNTKFGEYNGDLGCNWRADVPFKMAPLEDETLTSILESAFVANLFGDEDFTLYVRPDELMWVTNLKKAITSIFRNQLLKKNFKSSSQDFIFELISKNEVPRTFDLMEETIFGLCNLKYTVHPLPEIMSALKSEELERNMTRDDQRPNQQSDEYRGKKGDDSSEVYKSISGKFSKSFRVRHSNVPKLEDQLWHVTRTVDFENCEHNVILQRASGGMKGTVAGGQYEWLGGRSSVAEYILRGSGGAFRIEMATVEGGITSNALGMSKELLQSRTNQTLHLVSVEDFPYRTAVANYVEVKNWMQQVQSPFEAPTISPKLPWVTYTGDESLIDTLQQLTGIRQNRNEFNKIKEIIIGSLNFAAKALTAEKTDEKIKSGMTIDQLLLAKHLLEGLPKEHIKDLIEEVMVEKRTQRPHEILLKKLLVDLIAASGTRHAIELLIELASEKRLGEQQIFVNVMTSMQNLQDVTVIPQIMDFVMNIDLKESPFFGATAMLNFANLLKHYCVDPEAATVNYAGALFGDNTCNKQIIADKFIPYLKTIIYNEDLTWERLTAITALQEMAIPSSVQILAPIALGQKGQNTILRSSAIYALIRWNQQKEVRENVIELLTKIYTNVAESTRVRTAAVITVSTYGPDNSFWYSLARLSWREPSVAMAAVYKSLIEEYSTFSHPMFVKQNQAASHALRFTKPVVPSQRLPHVEMEVKNIIDKHIFKIQQFGYGIFDHPMKNTNFDAFVYSMTSLNGFEMTDLELMVSGGNLGPLKDTPHKEYANSDQNSKVANEFYKKIQDVIKAVPIKHIDPENKILSVYLQILDNIKMYLPITKNTLSSLPFADPTYLASMMTELQTGLNRVFGTFVVPTTVKQFLPNELGLPVLIQHTGGIVISDSLKMQLALSPKSFSEMPKKVHLAGEQYFRFASQFSGELHVFVPWVNSKLTTSVKSSRDITSPMKGTIDFVMQDESIQPARLEINLEPAYDSKYSVISASTIPSTLIAPLSLSGSRQRTDKKEILSYPPIHKEIQLPKSYAGLDLEVDWTAEFRFPLDLFGLSNIFSDMKKIDLSPKLYYLLSSPTAKLWSVDLKFDPFKSETKKFTFGVSCQFHEKQTEDIFQTGQSPEDVYSKQQQHYNVHRRSYRFDDDQDLTFDGRHQMETEEGNNYNNFQQRTNKYGKQYGGIADSCNATFAFHGTKSRTYEILYTWSKPVYSNQQKQTKSRLSLFRSPIPDMDPESLSVCIDTQTTSPVLSELDTLDSVLAKNLTTEITRTITPGCNGIPAIKMETTLKLSQERLEKMKHQITNSCEFDQYDPLLTFQNEAVYDDVQSKIQWEDVCDKARLPLLTKAISVLDRAFMRGFHTLDCDHQDTSNNLNLSLQRCNITDLWYFKATRDDDEFTVDAVPSNKFVDDLLSVAKVANPMTKWAQWKEGQISDKCSIGTEKVRSFDGNVYNYEASQCWTVAATDCLTDSWMVLVRAPATKSSTPEVRIIDRQNGVIVDMDRNVKVNEKVVDPVDFAEVVLHKGLPIAVVYKQDGNYMVKLPGKVLVAVKDKVEIKIQGSQEVCGLCGNNNAENKAEFVGPQQCVYTKADAFVSAWTAGGDNCHQYAHMERHNKAEQMQKSCLNVYDLAKLGSSYKHVPLSYVRRIYQEEELVCSTIWRQTRCNDGYYEYKTQNNMVDLNCWHRERAPVTITSAIANGQHYIIEPISEQPLKRIQRQITVALKCGKHEN